MDTVDWSCEEVGAYFRLLMSSWVNDYLPVEQDRLARIVQISRTKFSKIWQKIGQKFSEIEHEKYSKSLVNRKLEEVRSTQRKLSESRKESGKLGLEKRYGDASNCDGKRDGKTLALHSSSSSSSCLEVSKDTSCPQSSIGGPEEVLKPVPPKKSKRQDNAPHQKLIEMYHETFPVCQRVNVWRGSNMDMMRARWREHPDLKWWDQYFKYIARSAFLMGAVEDKGGGTPFQIDLAWIVRPSNMDKILNGRYHRGVVFKPEESA